VVAVLAAAFWSFRLVNGAVFPAVEKPARSM